MVTKKLKVFIAATISFAFIPLRGTAGSLTHSIAGARTGMILSPQQTMEYIRQNGLNTVNFRYGYEGVGEGENLQAVTPGLLESILRGNLVGRLGDDGLSVTYPFRGGYQAKGTPLNESNLVKVYRGTFVHWDIKSRFALVLKNDKKFVYYTEGTYTTSFRNDHVKADGDWSFDGEWIRLNYRNPPVKTAPFVTRIDVSRQSAESLAAGAAADVAAGEPLAVPMEIADLTGTSHIYNGTGLKSTDESPRKLQIRSALYLDILDGKDPWK